MSTPSQPEAHMQMKLHAAQRALQMVESGMTLGLGSGSTATVWIKLLGERVRDHGLKISFDECRTLDLTVDGADEIAPGLALIKGGGGKLLREKIVASASRRFVVVADASKQVEKLGRFPLPVEVIPMATPLVSDSLTKLGFHPAVRTDRGGKPYVTDEGNFILDCSGRVIEDPDATAAAIDSLVGVVEHGLFLHMADLAIIAGETQVIERKA